MRFVIKEIVNNYFVTDQKLALLKPLLDKESIFSSWDGTPGVKAVAAMRLTLYMAILSDMKSILFDTGGKTASMENVISALENKHFLNSIKNEYCKPIGVRVYGHDDDPEMKKLIEKQIHTQDIAKAEEHFTTLLPETIELFYSLKGSELAERVCDARNKMISHIEITTRDGERALYNPTDFGLKWNDARDIVEESKDIIFNSNLLINNSSYDLEDFLIGHKEAARSFWSVVNNA